MPAIPALRLAVGKHTTQGTVRSPETLRQNWPSDKIHAIVESALGSSLEARARNITLDSFGAPKRPDDDTVRLIVRDLSGKPIAVFFQSSSLVPGFVARNAHRARLAKERLGDNLGRVVPLPLAEGSLDGRSYAVHAYYQPLSLGRRPSWFLQRSILRPGILDWIRGVAAHTVHIPGPQEADERFLQALVRLHECEAMSSHVRASALRAAERLEKGFWSPRLVLAHTDLWQGNVLINRAARGPWRDRFMIIDWAGSLVDGHAIQDLVRIVRAFRVSQSQLRAEIAAHTRILECAPEDARSHLLAGFGDLLSRLEHYPLARAAGLTDACVRILDGI